MYNLNHPSYVEDLKKTVATEKELIEYLGDKEIFDRLLATGIITYADNSPKNESQDTESKPKSVKSSRGDK